VDSFVQYQARMIPRVNGTMIGYFQELLPDEYLGQKEIINYHFNWGDGEKRNHKGGKRLRPLILILAAECVGGESERALPAAAAVEFILNFSLIHDDIEDRDEFRHGQETAWKKFGVEKAINAGDALFSLAFLCLAQQKGAGEEILELIRILSSTCAMLTGGQDMDLEFETRQDISIDAYLTMVRGKTASLFEACCEMGALIGGGTKEQQAALSVMGNRLGLAFQIRDDWLGLWGDPVKTGKKAGNDLITGKKTLPILFAIQKQPELHHLFQAKNFEKNIDEEIQRIASTGASEYTIAYQTQLLDEAESELKKINIENPAMQIFKSLIGSIRQN
jgi:geranylgeranyl diphosphate synthase type I